MQSDYDQDFINQIATLEAGILAVNEGPEAGLKLLAERNTPNAIRKRLLFLFDAKRHKEAHNLIRNLPLHEAWCDRAIASLLAADDLEKATEALEWAKSTDNIAIVRRCIFTYAEGLFIRAFRLRNDTSNIVPGQLSDIERQNLEETLVAIQPQITLLLSDKRIRTEIESQIIQLSIRINIFLGNHRIVQTLSELLLSRSPIPQFVAQLAIDKIIDAPQDLAYRLRTEYPNELKPKLLAATIEGELYKEPHIAFDTTMRMVDESLSQEEQKEIFQVLHLLAQLIGNEAISRVEELIPSLLKSDEQFEKLVRASGHLMRGEPEKAKVFLDESFNLTNSYWLQLQAQYCLQIGNASLALDYFINASRVLPHPTILRAVAALAFECSQLDKSTEALETLLSFDPDDTKSRKNLALIYVEQGYFFKAEKHFGLLSTKFPEDVSLKLNHAECLTRSGNAEASLLLYEDLSKHDNPPLIAVIRQASILQTLGRVQEAYQNLLKFKTSFWDIDDYVSLLMSVSYAAGEEEIANQSLLRLKELQTEGRSNILQEKSIDDIVAEIQKYNDQKKNLLQQMIEGRMPWMTADHSLGYASYEGWFIRTQPLSFSMDNALERAAYSIYATNSLYVNKVDGVLVIDEIECTEKSTAVVVDLSSLLTLHRLNLLDKAASYFGKILIPSEYMQQILSDAGKLVVHQLSQHTAVSDIKNAIETQRILILQEASNMLLLPIIDEYSGDLPLDKRYHIVDMISELYKIGRISFSKYNELKSYSDRNHSENSEKIQLDIFQPIQIEMSTLKTISQYGLLEDLLSVSQVYINLHEKNQIISESRQIITQEQIKTWHKDLWQVIRSDERFVQVPFVESQQLTSEDQDLDKRFLISICATQLAQQLDMSILIDDRVCQSVMYNQYYPSQTSFSTNHLVVELGKSNLINPDEVADAFLQLVRWRYRFIVLPVHVLKTFVDRFKSHPPGMQLREIALYVHECMRDPGLLAGMEPTEIPVTLANRFYQAWCSTVAELVIDVWADEKFQDENARVFTKWAVQELLPSPPLSMGPNQYFLPAKTGNFVLMHAIIRSGGIRNTSRANAGIRAVAEYIGLNQEQYFRTVAEFINGN